MAALGFLDSINNVLFDERFWLPNNMTWESIRPPSSDSAHYPSPRDLIVPIPLALIIIVIRFFLEKYCFRPLALFVGIKPKVHRKLVPSVVLEKVYNRSTLTDKEILGLAKQLDWSQRQVERWLRIRRYQDTPSLLAKFTETAWRLTYYTCSVLYGAYSIVGQPWMTDTKLLFTVLPHSISTQCWWYCIITCGFYWSLLLTIQVDVKRKDFYEMVVHHFLAIFLMTLVWLTGAHRFMCMGYLMFDISDIFLELSKITKYANYQKTSTVSFLLLMTFWTLTRLIWYPFCMLRTTMFGILEYYGVCPLYYITNFVLLSFMALNMYWTYLIIKSFIVGLRQGLSTIGDPRSSHEDLSDTEVSNGD